MYTYKVFNRKNIFIPLYQKYFTPLTLVHTDGVQYNSSVLFRLLPFISIQTSIYIIPYIHLNSISYNIKYTHFYTRCVRAIVREKQDETIYKYTRNYSIFIVVYMKIYECVIILVCKNIFGKAKHQQKS